MRDAKGRFKSKELLLPIPSTTMVLNIYCFIKFILLKIEKINYKMIKMNFFNQLLLLLLLLLFLSLLLYDSL